MWVKSVGSLTFHETPTQKQDLFWKKLISKSRFLVIFHMIQYNTNYLLRPAVRMMVWYTVAGHQTFK